MLKVIRYNSQSETGSFTDASFEAFTSLKIQVEVFWVVMPCCVVLCCDRITAFRRQHRPPKSWYPTTELHGVITQKTSKLMVIYWPNFVTRSRTSSKRLKNCSCNFPFAERWLPSATDVDYCSVSPGLKEYGSLHTCQKNLM